MITSNFSTAHRARHSTESLATVAPYVGPAARQHLQARAPGEVVESVVVGAMRIFRVDIPRHKADEHGHPTRVSIAIEIEGSGHDALVFCDGRREMVVPAGGRLEVTRCSTPLKWVRLDSAPFTDRLVRKFRLPVTGWRGQ